MTQFWWTIFYIHYIAGVYNTISIINYVIEKSWIVNGEKVAETLQSINYFERVRGAYSFNEKEEVLTELAVGITIN